MAEDNGQEKTLEPSQRRIEKAREEGQVLRSRDLASALTTFSVVGALVFVGAGAVNRFMSWIESSFREAGAMARTSLKDQTVMLNALQELFTDALIVIAPLLIIGFVMGVLGSIGLGGFQLSTKVLVPDFGKLSPIKGLGRIFSTQGLGELFKSILKVVVLGGLAAYVVYSNVDYWVMLMHTPSQQAIVGLGQLLKNELLVLGAGLFAIAAFDVPFQWWQYYNNLKMTQKEMKEEMKESDGDPHVKGKIRQLQQQRARNRMMQAIPGADVVLTNPTHYAVALKYDESSMAAPQVVAKGTGVLASKIKELAHEHNVPSLESPQLARALYTYAELERDVPSPLFKAVAQVLAFIYRLKAQTVLDRDWSEISIPKEWDPHQTGKLSAAKVKKRIAEFEKNEAKL